MKDALTTLSAEELVILQLQKKNEDAEKVRTFYLLYFIQLTLQVEFTLNAIRKNQHFLVQRLRAVQLAKLGQRATITDPKNPRQRLVRFVVPRAPVEVVRRNAPTVTTVRAPHWRPPTQRNRKMTRVIQA